MADELIVVGGGAAGMMAAISAAETGAAVRLLERNPKVGRKLYITGKGRCNVTNHCPPEEVLASTPRNGRFLYGAVTRTPPAWVEDFFTGLGVPLKVERGNRVFPVSDRAADVIDALFFHMKKLNIPVTQARASVWRRDGCPGWRPIAASFPAGLRSWPLAVAPIRPPALPATDMRWPGPWAILWSLPFHPWSPWRQRRTSAEKCRAWR